jgi:hypothetical protein
VESVAVAFGPAVGAYWASGPFAGQPVNIVELPTAPNADTLTACAVVEAADSSRSIGWRALRVKFLDLVFEASTGRPIAGGDSVTAFLRGGNTLQSMCGNAYTGATIPDSTTAIPVAWSLYRMQIGSDTSRRMLRPAASRIIP